MNYTFLGGKVTVTTGDITDQNVDAIVNAANSTLLGGAGVDGAIHSKGGDEILEACKKIRETEYPNGLPAGNAVITTAGNLPAKFVIHTVGPIYGSENGAEISLLKNAYNNSLKLAEGLSLESIAFPAISTGAYGFPKSLAAEIVSALLSAAVPKLKSIHKIYLVYFSHKDTQTFIENSRF
ncbi:MAG: O-acetyl-ADP-ribose deacetylase [Pyrinomonadaceae bacterium]